MANNTQYRVRCETCGEVFTWADAKPTECPNNGGHTLVSGCIAIVSHTSFGPPLSFTFQNNGAVLNVGVQEAAALVVPRQCEIMACQLFGSPSGSIVVDLWKDLYANYPPADGDSIVASAPPTITSAVKSEDTTLTGWTKELAVGDIIVPNIDSVSVMTWAKLVLSVKEK